MLVALGYYLAATVLLAGVDAIRIWWKNKRVKHPVGNNDIKHAVSIMLAVAAAAVAWLCMRPEVVLFGFGCAGLRILAFDPLLNLFRRNPIDTISGKSSSITEKGWGKVPFWWRRAIGGGIILIVLIINCFV